MSRLTHSSLRRATALLLGAAMIPTTAGAGGRLENIDITGAVPSPIAGHVIGRLVGIEWDARCMPVQYSMNTTLDPVPNPLGAAFLSLADAQDVLQESLDDWNDIPTSFIDMQITGTTDNPGPRGFDQVNELTFRTDVSFGAIASSPSTSLIRDTVLTDGQDIDGDGDSDVSGAIDTCQDVDGDGDLELPAGLYPAGTILDNDVQFNTKTTNGLRFTVADADIDIVTRSVDLKTVALHEFGHSHGLSHTLDNQISGANGHGSTMFPYIDTGDPDAEREQRELAVDDIAWSSFVYPEGSAADGPGALQEGDVAFSSIFGLIRGEALHGVLGQPIAGASLSAIDAKTGATIASAISGTTQVSVSPTGGLFLVNPAFNIPDGAYAIPVPYGLYHVGIEALDGNPVPASSVSLTAQIGSLFGQLAFAEEFWSGDEEGAVEDRIGAAVPVPVNAGDSSSSGIDVVTNALFEIANFGNRNFVGFTGQAPGSYYAVRIPASQVEAAMAGGATRVQAARFNTTVADASVVPVFAEATLTTGTETATGAIVDLAKPLARAYGFVGQDNDFASLYFNSPDGLGSKVAQAISKGGTDGVYLVLRLPETTPFPGVSGLPPLIGLDGGVAANDAPIFGLSYLSTDGGGTFNRVGNFNFMFSLMLSAEP
jgi:hypothetical protein